MSFFKKSAEEKLFKAIEKCNVVQVRKLLATGADPNALNEYQLTPLDVCTQSLIDVFGLEGGNAYVGAPTLSWSFNMNLIWDELVRKDGKLNKYKNDPLYSEGFELTASQNDKAFRKFTFKAPTVAPSPAKEKRLIK